MRQGTAKCDILLKIINLPFRIVVGLSADDQRLAGLDFLHQFTAVRNVLKIIMNFLKEVSKICPIFCINFAISCPQNVQRTKFGIIFDF